MTFGKVKGSLILAFSLFMAVSCSSPQNTILNTADTPTLRNEIDLYEKGMRWTGELEGDLLQKDIYSFENIDRVVPLTAELFKIVNDNEKVYPYIENFGSLDTSSLEMTNGLTAYIKKFFDAANKNIYTQLDDFFDEAYFFNCVFFQYDLENDWPVEFETEFPQKLESEKDISIFNKFLIGTAFEGETLFQVPVRAYCLKNKAFIDFNFYITKDEGANYHIKEIEFTRWEKLNG